MRIFDFFFQKAISRRISAFQDEMMNRHVAEVENLYRQMRGWRHDYHNHIQMMKAYRALGQDDRLDAYLDELEQDLKDFDVLIRSGNVMIDAVLNSKPLFGQKPWHRHQRQGGCPAGAVLSRY